VDGESGLFTGGDDDGGGDDEDKTFDAGNSNDGGIADAG
jgi:hypothetical protein